jgi:hypothetical protein
MDRVEHFEAELDALMGRYEIDLAALAYVVHHGKPRTLFVARGTWRDAEQERAVEGILHELAQQACDRIIQAIGGDDGASAPQTPAVYGGGQAGAGQARNARG